MKDKKIPLTSARSQIESKIEDINLLLNSCMPFAAMHGLKNLSSDLRADAGVRISIEEYGNYMKRLEKMILDTSETCKCSKRKSIRK